jgi:photosystem II stability/assembly factor-like uncharacterized protein
MRTFASFVMASCAMAALSAAPAQAQRRSARQRPNRTPSATDVAAPAVSTATISGLKARFIGPAVTSGRVMTVAVVPGNTATIYVGSASGGVWKTTNGGVSWEPIFDHEGSYSIGWITLDPNNPNVVWVGTGERNSQRSVSYGDGVYKSVDGGRTWKNVGLKDSEHISRIVVNPINSDVVYVAAQGPLWKAGGDRGLYKTTDGGATWTQVLKISDNTGVTDVVLDPRNPDVLLASSYQRRRHQWTMIDGGPESAIYRSTDGAKTWNKVMTGLPKEELGRIQLAISPANPDVVYADVEAANRKGGIFRSDDGGITWTKGADFNNGAMYYADIYADPFDVDRLYITDTVFQVSDDGGKTLHPLGQRAMHVDNHVIWVDPVNRNHYLVGNDGGLYESWDRAAHWMFFSNLPVAQFYDVDVDNDAPFYNVYGGLQDNNSLGGPSRTRSEHGILNQDWWVTQGGDGFVSRIDPEDPNTIYAELQGGTIVRTDRRTGQRIGIQPQEDKGDPPLRWNWDAPFIISPHSHTRLYMAAQFLYRSDDRGSTWRKVSPDLTRAIDRNKLPIMGKVWGPDAVAKNTSTALYSNVSAIAESPKQEGLLYVGTDDGLIQVSEDGGATWRKVETFPGVPAGAYVSRIKASVNDAHTVYAAFEFHKNGDFAPYLLKSTDAGRTWSSIAGDLPARGSVYAFAEDGVDSNLLFAGTEFAAYATQDGGQHWLKIAGVPTIAVRDLAIQRRENDLVIGTFGRGIYILDDYTPLRTTTVQTVAQPATLYPVKDALLYVPTQQYGGRGHAFQGELFFEGNNPPFGAVLTYYLKDGLKTLKEKRVAAEQAAEKAGQPIAYPTAEQLRAEADEEPPAILLTVRDSSGTPVRIVDAPAKQGFQRVAWDLRLPAHVLPPNRPRGEESEFFGGGPTGPYAVPGEYSVTLSQRVGGVATQLAGPVRFKVVLDPQVPLTLADEQARGQFQAKLQNLRRTLAGALALASATQDKLNRMRTALDLAPAAPATLGTQVRAAAQKLTGILIALQGDRSLGEKSDPQPMSISERVNTISGEEGRTLAPPTATHVQQFGLATDLFAAQWAALSALAETDVPALEKALQAAGAPWVVEGCGR